MIIVEDELVYDKLAKQICMQCEKEVSAGDVYKKSDDNRYFHSRCADDFKNGFELYPKNGVCESCFIELPESGVCNECKDS